jgi:hypothetical protein
MTGIPWVLKLILQRNKISVNPWFLPLLATAHQVDASHENFTRPGPDERRIGTSRPARAGRHRLTGIACGRHRWQARGAAAHHNGSDLACAALRNPPRER